MLFLAAVEAFQKCFVHELVVINKLTDTKFSYWYFANKVGCFYQQKMKESLNSDYLTRLELPQDFATIN